MAPSSSPPPRPFNYFPKPFQKKKGAKKKKQVSQGKKPPPPPPRVPRSGDKFEPLGWGGCVRKMRENAKNSLPGPQNLFFFKKKKTYSRQNSLPLPLPFPPMKPKFSGIFAPYLPSPTPFPPLSPFTTQSTPPSFPTHSGNLLPSYITCIIQSLTKKSTPCDVYIFHWWVFQSFCISSLSLSPSLLRTKTNAYVRVAVWIYIRKPQIPPKEKKNLMPLKKKKKKWDGMPEKKMPTILGRLEKRWCGN